MRRWAIPSLASFAIAGSACGSDDSGACEHQAPGTVCLIAGNGRMAFNRDGLPAAETAFYQPSAVRRGPDGLLYIMDFNNMRLRRIEPTGTISTIVGSGVHTYATVGVPATESPLENPIDFDFLPDGRPILVSYHDPRVLVVDPDGTLQCMAGILQPGVLGNEGDGGPSMAAQFVELVGVTVGPDGAVYLADDMAHRVRVIRDGRIETLAGSGIQGYQGDGGVATAAALNVPTALAVDDTGNVYFADASSDVIRRISPDGTITTVAGTGQRGFSGDGGRAIDAQLAGPEGIAVASDGTLYIGDRLNNRIRKVAPDGTISTIAGTGAMGSTGNGGPARTATFHFPSRVQIDADGGLLISDQSNSSIRKIVAPL